MPAWYESRFSGLFSLFVRPVLRPHDPAVFITAAEMSPWNPGEPTLGGSGAGWTQEKADLACVGEGIERILARALPQDDSWETSFAQWSLKERAMAPNSLVLFHGDQYLEPGFPLEPFLSETVCRWVRCRQVFTGEPIWVPEEWVFLTPRTKECQRFIFGFSTGLSCGICPDQTILKGAQEVIERDAIVGAWWGAYSVEEWDQATIFRQLGQTIWNRVDRPNLIYRFYHIRTPFSSHAVMVSLSGFDEEGWVFSVGSACRETRNQSWEKALLEAIQGRHCVRRLLADWKEDGCPALEIPKTFFEHALYYSVHSDFLKRTVLENPSKPSADAGLDSMENLRILQQKLGSSHPVLFRHLTHPGIAQVDPSWVVFRVIIPGLQPLHGDHRLPFLGGQMWGKKSVTEWATTIPHPFA